MEKNTRSANSARESKQAHMFYLDGCKVSVRYVGEKNPSVVKNIKDALIFGIPPKKS
nr:hypothetical protein [uncultured Oscillibacter sp.]